MPQCRMEARHVEEGALAMRQFLLGLGVWAVLAGGMTVSATQPEKPQAEAAANYTVRARYRIQAGRTQRYRQFQALMKRLVSAGFVKEKGWEGEELYGDTINGTLPPKNKDILLQDEAIRAALMVPPGYTPPAAAQNTALVRLYLSNDFGGTRQRELADRARAKLKLLGFVEAAAYQHHEHRLLIGRLPIDKLADLTFEQMETEIPLGLGQENLKPFRTSLIRLAEVISEPADYTPLGASLTDPTVPADKPYLEKISPDLRRELAKIAEDQRSGLVRVELVLRTTPPPENVSWKIPLINPPLYMDVEGRLGPVVTGRISYGNLEQLARASDVSSIRLPHSASPILRTKNSGAMSVQDFRFVPLQGTDAPRVGQKVLLSGMGATKSAVIGTDFRGFMGLKGKGLPTNTVLLDLTAELTPELLPTPLPADGAPLGESTQIAMEYVKTYPTSELLLVRIDGTSPGQLAELARVLNGSVWKTDALDMRAMELNRDQVHLRNDQFQLQVQRRILQSNFSREGDAREPWLKYEADRKKVDSAMKSLGDRMTRYNQFLRQFRQLQGVRNVLLTVFWADGYPNLPNQLPILRYLDQSLLQTANWLQAIPSRTNQVWSGLFRDTNHDGVMEFVEPTSKARPDLNFLAWRTAEGRQESNLPQGTMVETMLQWQEAHDPRLYDTPDDPYRQPIAPLQVVILRQRDPDGKVVPSDVFEEVARTTAWPDRLENAPRWAHYQHTLRFRVERPGRYAVRIEGQAPTTTLPQGTAQLVTERSELRPKLVVDVANPESRQKGRVELDSFKTGE